MSCNRYVLRSLAWMGLLGLLFVVGCSHKTVAEGGASVSGEVSRQGAYLAYEHTVSIEVASDAINSRVEAVRAACVEERFGSCSVLRIDSSSGKYPSGGLSLRVVPAGVEPLVALGSDGGRVGYRQTRAEDLAEAVADVARQKQLLELQRDKLAEFQSRADLTVGDAISLTRELAQIETSLAALTDTANNQIRRIETNLLTLTFSAGTPVSRWDNLGEAIGDSADSFAEGAFDLITMLAYGTPFLLIAFPLALAWRWLWRRATSGKRRMAD